MPIRIPRPRGITTGQLMILTAVNVFAGIYIWQPLVLQQRKERIAKENSSSTASDSIDPAATEKISTTLKTDLTIPTDTKLSN